MPRRIASDTHSGARASGSPKGFVALRSVARLINRKDRGISSVTSRPVTTYGFVRGTDRSLAYQCGHNITSLYIDSRYFSATIELDQPYLSPE